MSEATPEISLLDEEGQEIPSTRRPFLEGYRDYVWSADDLGTAKRLTGALLRYPGEGIEKRVDWPDHIYLDGSDLTLRYLGWVFGD